MTEELQKNLQEGVRLLQAGQLEQAEALADSLLQAFPENPEPYLYAADAASLRGDRAGAIRFVSQILEQQPTHPQLPTT